MYRYRCIAFTLAAFIFWPQFIDAQSGCSNQATGKVGRQDDFSSDDSSPQLSVAEDATTGEMPATAVVDRSAESALPQQDAFNPLGIVGPDGNPISLEMIQPSETDEQLSGPEFEMSDEDPRSAAEAGIERLDPPIVQLPEETEYVAINGEPVPEVSLDRSYQLAATEIPTLETLPTIETLTIDEIITDPTPTVGPSPRDVGDADRDVASLDSTVAETIPTEAVVAVDDGQPATSPPVPAQVVVTTPPSVDSTVMLIAERPAIPPSASPANATSRGWLPLLLLPPLGWLAWTRIRRGRANRRDVAEVVSVESRLTAAVNQVTVHGNDLPTTLPAAERSAPVTISASVSPSANGKVAVADWSATESFESQEVRAAASSGQQVRTIPSCEERDLGGDLCPDQVTVSGVEPMARRVEDPALRDAEPELDLSPEVGLLEDANALVAEVSRFRGNQESPAAASTAADDEERTI